MAKRIPILALLLSLAACGEMRWAKSDGDNNSVAQDETSCRAEASDAVQRQYGPPTPIYNRQGDVRYGADPSIPSAADRQVLESQAVDRCMRSKGYALVPVSK